MNRSPIRILALSAALALLAGTAIAQEAPQAPAAAPAAATVPSQSAAEIVQFQRALRTRLDKPSGEYSRFDEKSLARMKRAQDKVFAMLDGVKSLDELNPYQKTDLSNALDEIKATLLANEGNRQICHRERKTGSNLITLRCETVAEREAHARDAERAMRDLSRTLQTTNGG